jgi:DNA-binding NarL/FixJ family response regulator
VIERVEMARVRVLVADDHAIMREGIRALLSLHDNIEIVGEAADGRQAVEKAREVSPDVVIMDIGMPLMDGLEASRRIRKEQPNVKILVLTRHDDREYVLSTVKAGAAGCISKRAVTSELVSAIDAVHRGDSFLHPSVARVLIEDYLLRTADEADPFDRLTEREREVLKLVAEGHSNKEIADLLVLGLKTVLGHRARIMEKLDVHNRTELIKYAIRKGVISLD